MASSRTRGLFVVDLLAQQLERVAHSVAPVAEHAGGGGAGPGLGAGQHALEQRDIDVVEALVQPEGLEHVVASNSGSLLFETGDPSIQRRQDFLRRDAREARGGPGSGSGPRTP